MLYKRYGDELPSLIKDHSQYKPFPTIDDRQAWAQLPQELQELSVDRAEGDLDAAWPMLTASLFMEFSVNGNRTRYEQASFERRAVLCRLIIRTSFLRTQSGTLPAHHRGMYGRQETIHA